MENNTCAWCGYTLAEHDDVRGKGGAIPKVPCGMLKSHFLPIKDTSPVVKAKNALSFLQAMSALTEGRRVTKLEWGNDKIYGVMKDGYLMIHKENGMFYQWILSDGDMTGNDWIVLSDTN